MRSARQFYRIQKSKRYPPAAKATLLRPLKTLHQISLKHRRRSRPTQGKAITGCSRFDLPLLASSSRSGTNWIRYFIATCTGRPTPGQTRLLSGDDYIIDQAHCTYPRVHKYSNVFWSSGTTESACSDTTRTIGSPAWTSHSFSRINHWISLARGISRPSRLLINSAETSFLSITKTSSTPQKLNSGGSAAFLDFR